MKKTVLCTTTLMHCKARQVLCDLFSTKKEQLTVVASKYSICDMKNNT